MTVFGLNGVEFGIHGHPETAAGGSPNRRQMHFLLANARVRFTPRPPLASSCTLDKGLSNFPLKLFKFLNTPSTPHARPVVTTALFWGGAGTGKTAAAEVPSMCHGRE